ncbi:MAG: L,D-transpeptidase family protein [Chloroflexi bacterium]|nr:L,D-transpeptidase family protein [Chloroflexota bacterium]
MKKPTIVLRSRASRQATFPLDVGRLLKEMRPWQALAAAMVCAVAVLAGCAQVAPMVQLPAIHKAPVVPPPAAPSSVGVTANGTALRPGAWTDQGRWQLSADTGDTDLTNLTPQAEFVPAGEPFSGQANVSGEAGTATMPAPNLISGIQYHWQLRLHRSTDGQDSAWVQFPGAIGFESGPVPAPGVEVLQHGGYLSTAQFEMKWGAATDAAGLSGYAFTFDQSPTANLPAKASSQATSTSLKMTKDGAWYFHIRAFDNAGNASPTINVPIFLDSNPLKIEQPIFNSDSAFNPATDTLPIEVKLSKPANVVLAIVPEKSDQVVRTLNLGETADAKLEWDGKDDHGQVVPAGNYRIRVDATDKTGRTAELMASDMAQVTAKKIVVSLSQEKLWAYDGDNAVVSSLITSGGPDLPTPTGTFHILGRYPNFVFHSPWPKGSPYWYPDSPTTYALLFESSGYFIHDSPWRSWYGPGSNSVAGTPGGGNTGTHGCINAPFSIAGQLYKWADVGMPVIIQN